MECIYKGWGSSLECVGYLDGNTVYTMASIDSASKIAGEVYDQSVYAGFGLGSQRVGTIGEHYIYDSSGVIGSFFNGTAYFGDGSDCAIAGKCETVEGAAALLLLLAPDSIPLNKNNHYVDSINMTDVILKIILIVLIVLFSIAVWPIIFSDSMMQTPGAKVYTLLTMLSTLIGLLIASFISSRESFLGFLFCSAIAGGIPELLFMVVLDSDNLTDPLLLVLPFILIFFTSAIPGFILYSIMKK